MLVLFSKRGFFVNFILTFKELVVLEEYVVLQFANLANIF